MKKNLQNKVLSILYRFYSKNYFHLNPKKILSKIRVISAGCTAPSPLLQVGGERRGMTNVIVSSLTSQPCHPTTSSSTPQEWFLVIKSVLNQPELETRAGDQTSDKELEISQILLSHKFRYSQHHPM